MSKRQALTQKLHDVVKYLSEIMSLGIQSLEGHRSNRIRNKV